MPRLDYLIEMLELIHIKNFKSLREVTLNLRRINVFIGPNGSGKSSVLQALLVLKQSLRQDRNVKLNGDYISLGNFKDAVYSKARKPQITIGLAGVLKGIGFDYAILFDEQGLRSHEVRIKNEYNIQGTWERTARRELKPTPEQIIARQDKTVSVSLICDSHIAEPIRRSGGSSGSSEETRVIFDRLYESIAQHLSVVGDTLQKVFVVPGFRGIDERGAELQDRASKDFVTSEGVSKQASNFVSTVGYNPEILDQISRWLVDLDEKNTEMRHRLIEKSAPDQKTGIAIEVVRPNLRTNIVNEGLGLNQLTFPLGVLATAPTDSLIAIEEPEIHLHPKLQSKLIDLFVNISKSQSQQLVLVTHSEHVLFRLLTKIAQGDLTKEELTVFYFSKKDLATTVDKLEVTDNGQIKGGLPEFFEEELEQFRDYLDALVRK